jgi:hypothetical protein|tara:strand:+ start:970 stop:1605 length:636 start_codon:yes stop_codon:yes gene_type:complete
MVTTYCSVADVSDFLRAPITATTTPNKAQVEKIIKRKEDELDRRMGHAWRTTKITREVHDLPLLYKFGWGTPVFLKHRRIYDFDSSAGDKIEIWQGASSTWEDILGNTTWYDIEYERGTLALRGFIFSILRKSRVRVTYRYGGEDYSGDTVIPYDIEDAIVKMTAIELLNTSFRMDELPTGGMSNTSESKRKWEEDIEKCVDNRREIFVIP